MARDRRWVLAHSGPMTPRRMGWCLERIAAFVGRATEDLAVTKVSRREDPFAVLVATIISLRTRDEVTDVAAPTLLARAPDPAAMTRLAAKEIESLIYPAGFYRMKAKTLLTVSKLLIDRHGGRTPEGIDELVALPGVGRKTANLVVTLGHGKPGICVDTHVHRISNRLGFVKTKTPDDTETVLRARLPRRYWIPINDWMVAFGRGHCGPLSPKCSTCPVRSACARAGVKRSR